MADTEERQEGLTQAAPAVLTTSFWRGWGIPQSDEELHEYIRKAFLVYIPDAAVCEGHTSPFRFIADAFFERFQSALLYANRGGGKTWASAIIHALNCRFRPKVWTTHVGATDKQAHRCYDKFKDLLKLDSISWTVDGDPLMSKTGFHNGAVLEILPGTMKQTSGPHPQKAVADEVEDMPWPVYSNFLQMPQTSEGVQSQIWHTSAHRLPTGTMARLVTEHRQRGIDLYKFCVFETVKPTPRCGGSHDCPIFDLCGRKCERSRGYVEKRDVFQRFRSDPDGFHSQQMCRKPSAGDLEFSEWDDLAHMGNFRYDHDGTPPIVGWDWGYWPDPGAAVVIQRQSGLIRVLEEFVGWRREPEWYAALVRGLPYGDRIVRGWGSPDAGRDRLAAWARYGISMRKADPDVDIGLDFVHKLLSTTLGRPVLGVDSRCVNTATDFAQMPPYRMKPRAKRSVAGQGDDESHFDAAHAVRYGCFSEWGSKRLARMTIVRR